MNNRRNRGNLKKLGLFLGHMLSSAAVFLIVLVINFGIDYALKLFASWGADPATITVLTYCNLALLVVDVLLMLWAAVWSIFDAFRTLR